MVNPETVCNYTLHHWKDSATGDGHAEEPGSTARQRAELRLAEVEDLGNMMASAPGPLVQCRPVRRERSSLQDARRISAKSMVTSATSVSNDFIENRGVRFGQLVAP